MRTPVCACLISAVTLAACGGPARFPGMEAGETGRVVRIIDGDSLVLDGGQSVRLVGIEAPRTARSDRPGDPYGDESARLLEAMVLGRTVRLYYPGPTRDRYDRALAHMVTQDGAGAPVWVNLALVDRGSAWVWMYPDTDAGADMLLEGEAHARSAGLGLWALDAYRPTSDIPDTEGPRLLLLSGTIGPALDVPADADGTKGPKGSFACRRALSPSALTVWFETDAAGGCRLEAGQRVEIRTVRGRGRVTVTHDRHISEIQQPARNG